MGDIHISTLGLVDCEECAIAQNLTYTRDRATRQRALEKSLVETLLDRWNIVAWHVPTHDDALECGITVRRALPLRSEQDILGTFHTSLLLLVSIPFIGVPSFHINPSISAQNSI